MCYSGRIEACQISFGTQAVEIWSDPVKSISVLNGTPDETNPLVNLLARCRWVVASFACYRSHLPEGTGEEGGAAALPTVLD